MKPLRTDRLVLRQWRDGDRPAFAAMNADPCVMRFFGFTRTREQSDAIMNLLSAHIAEHGFGFFALELRASGEVIGFTGLQPVDFDAAFTPAVEIGWRLLPAHWGKGYATEAAAACLDLGFGRHGLAEIVSFAVVGNRPSRRVMERIGMRREPAFDFDHPRVEAAALRRHAFYRIAAEDFRKATAR